MLPFFTTPLTAEVCGAGAQSDVTKGLDLQTRPFSGREVCLTGIELPLRAFSKERLFGGIAVLGVLSTVGGGLRGSGLGELLPCVENLSNTGGGLVEMFSPDVLRACLLSKVVGGLNICSSPEGFLLCLDGGGLRTGSSPEGALVCPCSSPEGARMCLELLSMLGGGLKA